MTNETEDPRRSFLVQALGLGLFAAAAGYQEAGFGMGDIPSKLPNGRSIYKLHGRVLVDGKVANLKTMIKANSRVETGTDSQIIFVVGRDAFILRSNSQLQLGGNGFLIEGMRMLTGKLLSVFGRRPRPYKIQTATATIGIRGTGIYIESDAGQSYVCTCYGHTLIAALADSRQQQEVVSHHHDQPLYILPQGSGQLIRPAPFINHTDVELALIEELVGRSVPFAFNGGAYSKPRKRTY